jgi:hypothetical protein
MGPTGCPKTSVRIYHYSLRNDPEERSSVLLNNSENEWLQEEMYEWTKNTRVMGSVTS